MIRNSDRYLSAVISEYTADCAAGFPNDYEARRKLWHCAVIIWETAEEPEPYLDRLRDLSLGIIRPVQIETTIRSAERRVGSHA